MALPDLIPVEDFFSPPERAGATISPDGTRIAYLAPWRDRLNVWVQGLDPSGDLDGEPRCVTADQARSVQSYQWTDDPRWLLYLQDSGGDENWHLFRVDLDAAEPTAVDLTPFPGARVVSFEPSRGRPGKLAVSLNARDAAAFDLHELDVATGELTVLAESPGAAKVWAQGREGELIATALNADNDFEISRHDSETDTTSTVLVYEGADYPLGVFPAQVTPDGTGMWIGSSRGTDRTRLVRVDLSTGEETEVDSHATFDIDTRAQVFPTFPSPLIRDRRGELLGVRYLGERQVVHALDPDFAEVLANLEKLSEGDLAAVSCDDSGQRWVVGFTHDRAPGATWFYDHSTGESRLLFRPHPHLDPDAMAPMRPVTITARDGLELPSYLTLPVGVEPRNLPMVLLVHGGPWARDAWGFDPTVQLLANRGYAVLQVNFRGSTGFGKAHMKAAIGEFAGKMHDDLIDAVDWAVERGYADPDRVAIFGGSYGGYAALVGVTFTPDRFAAAVDYVGISDLANFMRNQPVFVRPALANNWYRYVGDPDIPEQEADMLARSPISRVDRITAPLFVAQGANDARVVKAESDNIVAALRERGVDVEYLLKEDEGHGFVNPENQLDLHRAAERFLARHLDERRD
ncbi:S9 family peptidase [Nocardiopsis dassonvillei]|uniref:Peptidase S9 prolyl oligopeptidase active site domain protein n=1 Tax=Nocardiopsis dassonvillei (strain ATCC 23218 / DSM 43111 / CIP 107115 / JCM 7437 / KCTC 9190 / NBRC 14626 / NCTC 10488 / NRRL B-5397 / IMRU 509) TaxID=446468 RepID=D7B2K7_NOCDD|nr:S9 family peptidase [Nocardiopsis dassonvillei]ADH66705.1 peptidase S9 prolyl oligopeptidase active site domain protein [Nocardiopsis dassonvillei subsp. dassonvillei DSM 43111]NKY80791.1 S9 family peptidase [Nocardiopsis dassonvillei]VEI92727.1 Protease 2 [Nocardiopsis dassonvillei]